MSQTQFSVVKAWIQKNWAALLSTITTESISTTGTITAGTLKVSDLTTGRVPYATTNGQLTDEAALAYNAGTNTLTVGTVSAATLLSSDLTSGRVPYATTSGQLTDEAALAYNAGTNTLTMGVADVTGAATVGSTLGVTGASTLTGGIVATVDRVSNVPIGDTALGSLGTNTTPVAGTLYLATVWLPANKSITGIAQLNGTAVGTDKTIVSLWADDGSALLANSDLAGTTCTGTDAWQEVPFTAPYAAVGPGRYWVGIQVNGTTCRLRTIAASTYLNYTTSGTPGAFGTLGSTITPATTTTGDVGPVVYLY